jgi:hypothetical protein
MKLSKYLALSFLLLFVAGCQLFASPYGVIKPHINMVLALHAHSREQFGAAKLSQSLIQCGYTVTISYHNKLVFSKNTIVLLSAKDSIHTTGANLDDTLTVKEGFEITSYPGNKIVIKGADYSGVLYGCLELAERIKAKGILPKEIHFKDAPEMVMRGACIGMQKTTYLPGRKVYEYPYTPETFPWFYDKALWIKYLDMLTENRMNSLYLWSGHPFASLVKLKDYPYAVEVDDATFKKNEEMFRFLTKEADKRGIWIIQMFYNIIVSKPFAEKNHLKTQDRERPIIPIIADYTRKSIAAFVEKYPNVGLGVTLGEAMEGVGQDDIDWFTKTIIPGVKDGMKTLGITEEPPLVLRAHDTDAPSVIKASRSLYHNLYTMAKYNGEALTTYTPRGSWAELHRTLSRMGTVQIENVHILANLEPFRYGSADFIQKCVKAMHSVYEANGLHIYPQASFWDWPYAADSASSRLLEMDRDWIWYKEWSRYAWNCHRDRQQEVSYWSKQLGDKYGVNAEQGGDLLEAYEQMGEIAPKLLRRFGITDGNRQTLTLGMLMTQLINPYRYGLFDMLYDSESPEGEKLIEYAAKEWKHEKHIGETPVQIDKEVVEHGRKAVEAINKVTLAGRNKEELARLKNDVYCNNQLAIHYAEKTQAALSVLRYNYSNDINDLKQALPHLQKSVTAYAELARLTQSTYLYANSMQTQQRKIPMRGVNATYKTWVEMLPVFQKELDVFTKNIDSLESHPNTVDKQVSKPLSKEAVTILSGAKEEYELKEGISLFTDTTLLVKTFAKDLEQLKGTRLSFKEQVAKGTSITFANSKPVKVLVGFFDHKSSLYLKAPELETNASANDYGQSEIKISNALVIPGMPAVNIHTYSFKAGTNTLVLAKGVCLVLGFVKEEEPMKVYDALLNEPGKKNIDWLFEN